MQSCGIIQAGVIATSHPERGTFIIGVDGNE